MPTARLPDRALISVVGPDAEHLLQNVITADLDTLKPGEAMPSALLLPQGKILFDFLVSRSGENGLLLECRADVADDLVRRLMLYRLRAKAEISKLDQDFVTVSWETESDSSPSGSASSQPGAGSSENDSMEKGLRDLRFAEPARVWRCYGDAAVETSDLARWHRFRVAQGIPESGSDYALGDTFPHDVLLDQMSGVGFRKGCYVGQEVVSRMQHRGTARRRAVIASAEGSLPSPGTEIVAAGRPIGTLGSVAGDTAIALVRLDKAKAAMDAGQPITAGEATLSLAIPSWARFTFPQDTAASEEA
ncbi:folate-binding protein YgfZ [Pseudaminobacter sp. 19-2017]|uniref:Folate-binding protein YgfZ n=1 Tax=Pseudaminobacter soli (ex Zhang et al. 2022) TaxID=2831468 RepID=A0A942DYP7_9HYPH|nr:folate-binding protein YgfZ [Pseudaminobacter soli]MBS3650664.1 folate-binding protein YgfZ [Pseudaminobacter soli]